MEVYKNKGLIYSQYVLDSLINNIDRNINASVEPFYNCREQGYLICFMDKDYSKHLNIWVYAQRHSDEPTITWNNAKVVSNMFNEDDWKERTLSTKNIEDLVNRIEDMINTEIKGVQDNE